jgi:hypothetical protein
VSQEPVKKILSHRIMDLWAANQLVESAAGIKGNEETKEKLRLDLNKMLADLAGPNPSPSEHILANVAALNWFALHLYEARYASASNSEKGQSFAQSEHSQRRIERTHRRLLTALKTLATVRRLALPAIQVNVARQQVNVAGSASTVPRSMPPPPPTHRDPPDHCDGGTV